MNYAAIKDCDIANGPGVRVSLFVSGCPHHCKGCFNAEAWDFNYGKPFTPETQAHLLTLLSRPHIRGLTLLGGEPFAPENQGAVVDFLRNLRKTHPEKSIWAFTGYVYDRDLSTGSVGDPDLLREYLGYLDVLVDGPFVEELKNLGLRFRGSSNQRLIDMPATLRTGQIVLWQDWQGFQKGLI